MSESRICDELREGEPKALWIGNEERKQLVEILFFISVLLDQGKIWFNEPGPGNAKYSELCMNFAKRLANMKVETEQ